jgi:hypothetical protein
MTRVRPPISNLVGDLLAVVGFGLICAGLWHVAPVAALIFAGGSLMFVGIMAALK